MTQWCQGCPGPVAEPHQCTFQLLPRHNEVLSWTYSTCSATRREHHTKSQRPETVKGSKVPYRARNGKVSIIYLSIKIGSFQMPRFAIRCRVHWGQVRWMECSTSDRWFFDGFFDHLKWQLFNFYTLQALQALLGITPSHARKVQLLQSAVNYIQYIAVLPTLTLHVWCYKYEKFITPRQDIQIVNQVSALLYSTLVFVSAFLQSLPSQDPRHQPCWLHGPPEPSDVSTVVLLSSTPNVESMETETLLRPTSCFVSQQKHTSHHEPKPMKTWRIGYRPGSQCSKERQRALERPDLCRFQLIHVDSRIRRLYRNIARQDAASPRNGTRTRTWHQRNQWVMWFGIPV